jgi:hypothetical protein
VLPLLCAVNRLSSIHRARYIYCVPFRLQIQLRCSNVTLFKQPLFYKNTLSYSRVLVSFKCSCAQLLVGSLHPSKQSLGCCLNFTLAATPLQRFHSKSITLSLPLRYILHFLPIPFLALFIAPHILTLLATTLIASGAHLHLFAHSNFIN